MPNKPKAVITKRTIPTTSLITTSPHLKLNYLHFHYVTYVGICQYYFHLILIIVST